MTELGLPPHLVTLDDILSLHQELYLIQLSLDSLYEFVEYHMFSKDASLAAPIIFMIGDRLRHAGQRYEEILSMPPYEHMF